MSGKEKCFGKGMKLLIICFLCLFVAGCNQNRSIEKNANRVVQAIENNDMETLGQLLFGESEVAADEPLSSFFQVSERENSGIIEKIIEQDTVKIKKITDECVVYVITAPNLSEIFQDVLKEERMSKKDFEEYIYKYIESAKKIDIEVKIPYSYEEGIFKADYSSKEFVEAITGNMISSYQNLIQEMIQENNEEKAK